MKHFERMLLLVIALTVGGGLGYKLLPDFEPVMTSLHTTPTTSRAANSARIRPD